MFYIVTLERLYYTGLPGMWDWVSYESVQAAVYSKSDARRICKMLNRGTCVHGVIFSIIAVPVNTSLGSVCESVIVETI